MRRSGCESDSVSSHQASSITHPAREATKYTLRRRDCEILVARRSSPTHAMAVSVRLFNRTPVPQPETAHTQRIRTHALLPSAETKDLVGHAFVSPLPLGEGARGSSLLCPKRSLGHALGSEGAGVVEEGGGTDVPVGARVMFTGLSGASEDGAASGGLRERRDS